MAAEDCDMPMAPESEMSEEEIEREAEGFKEQGNAFYIKKDYSEAFNFYTKAIDACPKNASYYGNRAATLMMLNRHREALEDAQQAVRMDDMFVKGYLREGKCHLSLGNGMAASRSFQRLKHAKAVLEYERMAEIDFEKRDFRKLKKLEQAIEDCTNAIKLDETYIKAYLRRAQCYLDTEQYEEAVRDYEKVYQTEKTKGKEDGHSLLGWLFSACKHKHLLKTAQLELKKSKRKDYYKILGVDKNATDDEIKKAYRKRALMHHPDRHSGASPEMQKEEEKKFKEVGEAFTVLSDPKKKARYDSGQDLDEEGMNMGVAHRKSTRSPFA
ncbi:DnaJ-like subfamily C member 7 [Acipenser ruthenus]|uniref:DnaJ-like subfamily C member 7 n=1 Tax=Acipenser ruthenus TaxID=7906 RepID=A0A444UK55_ACIRT|nr:DnaJ-like subfamily C member 7 [Acipenser ruthenus]